MIGNILRGLAYLANRLNGSLPPEHPQRARGLDPGDYLQAQQPLVR